MRLDQEPQEKRARKGLGTIAMIVLGIVAAIFIGYNILYMTTNA